MKNPQDQTNMMKSLRRVHNAKTNKANGSSSNLLLLNENEDFVQKVHVVGGRERLKRHREEVAGRVLIPDTWGQEDFLQDWIDCSAFEALLVPNKIASARKALVADGRTSASHQQQLRIESRC